MSKERSRVRREKGGGGGGDFFLSRESSRQGGAVEKKEEKRQKTQQVPRTEDKRKSEVFLGTEIRLSTRERSSDTFPWEGLNKEKKESGEDEGSPAVVSLFFFSSLFSVLSVCSSPLTVS